MVVFQNFKDGHTGFTFDQATENIEWNIEDTEAVRSLIEYPCCPGVEYVDITFSLHIRSVLPINTCMLGQCWPYSLIIGPAYCVYCDSSVVVAYNV